MAATIEEPTSPNPQYDDKGNKILQAKSPEQMEEVVKQDKKQKCASNSQGQSEVNRSTFFAVNTPNKNIGAANKDTSKEKGNKSNILRPAGSSKNVLG